MLWIYARCGLFIFYSLIRYFNPPLFWCSKSQMQWSMPNYFCEVYAFFSYFCSRNCYEMSKKSLTFWIVSLSKIDIYIKKIVTSRKNCRFWLILNDIIDIEKKKACFIFLFYAFFAFMFLLFCFSFIFHLLLECAESWMSTWQKGIYFFFWPFFFP